MINSILILTMSLLDNEQIHSILKVKAIEVPKFLSDKLLIITNFIYYKKSTLNGVLFIC